MFNPPKSDAKYAPPTTPPNGFSTTGGAAQTVIARGVRVDGDFRSQGNVSIEGELVGSLTCGGHLTIGPEASIQAAVTADEATIAGTVEGNLQIARKVELKATAKLKGDITAETVAIEPGATLVGMFTVGTAKRADAREPVAAKPKTEPTINTPAEAKSGSSA